MNALTVVFNDSWPLTQDGSAAIARHNLVGMRLLSGEGGGGGLVRAPKHILIPRGWSGRKSPILGSKWPPLTAKTTEKGGGGASVDRNTATETQTLKKAQGG